jgi:hypothetical protein
MGMDSTSFSIEAAKTEQAKVNSVIAETALNGSETTDLIDLKTVTLQEARNQTRDFQKNIATEINELDELTNSFGEHFQSMQRPTAKERLIGFFSKNKAQAMRMDRITESSIEQNLDNMLHKSNAIESILKERTQLLEQQLLAGLENARLTSEQLQEVANQIVEFEGQLEALRAPIEAITDKIATEVEFETRTELQNELQERLNEFKKVESDVGVARTKAQSLERYRDQNRMNVDVLSDLKAVNESLINKLKIDTQQRAVLFTSYQHQIRTSEQHETAHKLNEIGTNIDKMIANNMASIASAAKNRHTEMAEKHAGDMLFNEELLKRKHEADEVVRRRMAKVFEQQDSGQYS